MEKYAVTDAKDLQRQELAQVKAEIQTLEANPVGMTKEASARLEHLRQRKAALDAELA